MRIEFFLRGTWQHAIVAGALASSVVILFLIGTTFESQYSPMLIPSLDNPIGRSFVGHCIPRASSTPSSSIGALEWKAEITTPDPFVDELEKESFHATDRTRTAVGTFVLLCSGGQEDVCDARAALRKLRDGIFSKHGFIYPVTIFHEDLPISWIRELAESFPQMHLEFIRIRFETPSHLRNPDNKFVFEWHSSWSIIVQESAKIDVRKSKRADRPLGYFHMCRFFAGPIARLPSMIRYEFYWRIDSDSMCDVTDDLFHFMINKKSVYGWTRTSSESGPVVRWLWNTIASWVQSQDSVSEHCKRADLSRLEWLLSIESSLYPTSVFYNNFEIVRLSWMRSSLYRSFFDYIDQAGGIFFFRWGDAPIRTIAIQLMLSSDQVIKLPGCDHPIRQNDRDLFRTYWNEITGR